MDLSDTPVSARYHTAFEKVIAAMSTLFGIAFVIGSLIVLCLLIAGQFQP
jgi:hypothetical protein